MFENNMTGFTPLNDGKQKVFISFTDGGKRAVTLCGIGNTVRTAYESARNVVIKTVKKNGAPPVWTCMDFVDFEERVPLGEFFKRVAGERINYFRYGVALDEMYRAAFLEQELNCANLIDNKQTPIAFHNENITKRLKTKGTLGAKETFQGVTGDGVTVFGTKACFYDGEYHDLHQSGLDKGMRRVDAADRKTVRQSIFETTQYLAGTVNDDGTFVYGYFPAAGTVVPGYNIIRHILSVMALMDTYDEETDEGHETRNRIEKTFKFVMEKAYHNIDKTYGAVVDHANGDDVRLGALGLAVLMITKHARMFGTDEYMEPARKMANQMLMMQDTDGENAGRFVHVLQYPLMTVKEEFKIVYYSGEAVYGLMALYEAERDGRYLQACKAAFEYFIKNDYHKYYDHWLAYAANELTRHEPDDRYFKFAVRNAMDNIDFIIERETAYSTMLEMLNATRGVFNKIKELGREYLFGGYDINKFYTAVEARVRRQMHSVMYPEKAMFFKHPKSILYGSYIRHHSFRVRNDDVAHHLIGLYNFLKADCVHPQ
jgi:hypothetical protein